MSRLCRAICSFPLCIFLTLATQWNNDKENRAESVDIKLLSIFAEHVATACVEVHFLFSPFSFSSVSLSDSLFSSVTISKRVKNENIV